MTVKRCGHPVNADGPGDYYCHDQPPLLVLAPVGGTARLWWGGICGGSLPQGKPCVLCSRKSKLSMIINPTKSDPAEHPGGGEGDVRGRVAQSGGHAGTDVAEEVMGLGGGVFV